MVKTASSKSSIKGQRALLNPDAEVKQVTKTKNNRGVVFFKNLPLGFFEPQLKRFLAQFGEISRIRISKSAKVRDFYLQFNSYLERSLQGLRLG